MAHYIIYIRDVVSKCSLFVTVLEVLPLFEGCFGVGPGDYYLREDGINQLTHNLVQIQSSVP